MLILFLSLSMGKNVTLEAYIHQLLESESIDDKRRLRDKVVELFDKSNFEMPIAIRLNLSLRLKDVVDNYIIHDNFTSRETLKNFFTSEQLLQQAS